MRSARRKLLAGSVVSALLAGAAATASAAPAPAATASADSRSVIVQSRTDAAAAADAVRRAGGQVTAALPIVDGVAAAVPADAVSWLRAQRDVLSVTPNSAVTPSGAVTTSSNPSTIKQAYFYETNADRLHQRGLRGEGQVVALIDTGVTEVPDLAGRILPVVDPANPNGQQVRCVNFSGEAGCTDTYGHGTFIAGLIAGSGAASGGQFVGVAPAARIISLKLAGRSGATDVSKVLAALQWVVSFKEQYGIGAVNLSLGTDSDAPTETDPMNRAVQRAVQAGLAVVVAAGNSGTKGANGGSAIFKPADDPLVLTVGAVNDRETPSRSDDITPRFTSRGPTAQGRPKPDVVAPGAHLVSLISPGSYVEEAAKGAGVVNSTYRRGSGTSFANGVVTGLVALVRQARPAWSPLQVKAALMSTATPTGNGDPNAIGKGLVDGLAALDARPAPVAATPATGELGLLDDARGSVRVVVRSCSDFERQSEAEYCSTGIRGEVIARANGYDLQAWSPADFGKAWNPTTWYESQWVVSPQSALDQLIAKGREWTSDEWTGREWTGREWTGSEWTGGSDTQSYGTPRRGSAWYGTAE